MLYILPKKYKDAMTSGSQEVRKSGSQEVRKSGSQEVRKSGSQEVRKSGSQDNFIKSNNLNNNTNINSKFE